MTMEKIIYVICKVANAFPIGGGAIGALSQIKKLTEFMPSWETLISALIVSIAGACLGFLVKLLLETLVRKLRKKYKKTNPFN